MDHLDDAVVLLLYIRDDLGVNAFIATDPQIGTDEIGAATQSLAFTRAANATVFVVPTMGDTVGVGIETGANATVFPHRSSSTRFSSWKNET